MFQSLTYARYLQVHNLYRLKFLIARDASDQIVGRLWLSCGSPIPEQLLIKPLDRLLAFSLRGFMLYRWIGGPHIEDAEHYADILEAVVHKVDQLAQREAFLVDRVSLPFYGDEDRRDIEESVFSRYGFSKARLATIVVDLFPDLDILWHKLKNESRYKVRRAERQGVQISEVEDMEGLYQFYSIYRETCRRAGVVTANFRCMKLLWECFRPMNAIRVFISHWQNHPISGQIVIFHKDIMHLHYVSHSDFSKKHKIYGNDLMQWHLIRWGREHGYRLLDYGGYAVNPMRPKEVGMNQFKERWGGRIVEYNVYSKIYKPWRLRLFQLLRRAKS